MPWRIRWNLWKSHRDNFRLRTPITYSIDERPCTQSGESFRIDIPWSEVKRVEQWRGAYLLYMSKKLAHLIPARAFSAEQERRFQQFLDVAKPGWRKP